MIAGRLRALVKRSDKSGHAGSGYNLVVHDYSPPRGSVRLARYSVAPEVYVEIYEKDGLGYYIVREPLVSPVLKEYVERLLGDVGSWLKPSPAMDIDPIGYFESSLRRIAGDLPEKELKTIMYYVRRDVMGYGPIDPILRDPLVEDVSCEGAGRELRVWHSKYNASGWLTVPLSLPDDVVDVLVRKMSIRSGRPLSSSTPVLDASLPEGYRVTATWRREVSSYGSSFTIRKFRQEPYTLPQLVEQGMLSERIAAFLWMLAELKGFILIAGPSASGKTTLANAIALMLRDSWKIITIEDVRELNLYGHPGWKPLHTREGGIDGYGRVSLFDLVKMSLRERPDYVVLGETRGSEARILFQAALTGHGCLTTFHATDEESLAARLTQAPINVPQSLVDLVDVVVFVSKLAGDNGAKRVVIRVSEKRGSEWSRIFWYSNGSWEGDPMKSLSLAKRASAYSLTAYEVKEDLGLREDFLREAVRKQSVKPGKLRELLQAFYAARRAEIL